MNYKIVRLTDKPELKNQAAGWFHEKWGIPLEAYLESMDACLEKKAPVPAWYMALENERIIGGLGVIEIVPNVCAPRLTTFMAADYFFTLSPHASPPGNPANSLTEISKDPCETRSPPDPTTTAYPEASPPSQRY